MSVCLCVCIFAFYGRNLLTNHLSCIFSQCVLMCWLPVCIPADFLHESYVFSLSGKHTLVCIVPMPVCQCLIFLSVPPACSVE